MNTTSEQFAFVSVIEAAEMLGFTTRWVIKLVQAGKFPGARKVNPEAETSAWLIPTAEIEAFIEQQKEKRA